jgi:hypothetical protein
MEQLLPYHQQRLRIDQQANPGVNNIHTNSKSTIVINTSTRSMEKRAGQFFCAAPKLSVDNRSKSTGEYHTGSANRA